MLNPSLVKFYAARSFLQSQPSLVLYNWHKTIELIRTYSNWRKKSKSFLPFEIIIFISIFLFQYRF